jgi:hypothetical protein
MSTTNYPHTGRGAPIVANPARTGRRQFERRHDPHAREQLVQRVLSEFREMPCLRLTPQQAQRLFGLREDVTTRVIDTLIVEGHIRQDADGRYVATKNMS